MADISKLYIKYALPVRLVKLDCDGEGVRSSCNACAGDEHLMSKEAALNGDGDRLAAAKG